ncbi:MAG: 7TM-DISM domain-containing protein, partial [Alcanivoracaceae bacterium]|nr:7TM-DISM domain-containing protein [Alcanivoracaceae bacterium]
MKVCAVLWRVLAALMLFLPLMAGANLADVSAVWTDEVPTRPLGLRSMILQEAASPLDIDAVRAQVGSGFQVGQSSVPTFGIGPKPVWIRLVVENPDAHPIARLLLAGTTWIDRLDFYAIHAGQIVSHQVGGDQASGYLRPRAGMGYLFKYEFPPGSTEIYLRAATADPLLLPLRLLGVDDVAAMERATSYSYGLVYGFVLALLAYNLMLYFGLAQPSHRDYSIYLLFFGLMNLAYTGHGYAWLWPDS